MMAWVIAAPLLSAILTIAFRDRETRRLVRVVLAATAAALPLTLAGSIDGLSCTFTVIVSVLGLLATVFSTGTFAPDWGIGRAIWSRKSVYFVLLGAFWSAMLLVVLADNFAALWLGISATTLATAFLVGFSGEAAALEAAWKYLVLCSVGIGFALLGIVALAHVAIAGGIDPRLALSWTAIAGHTVLTTPSLAQLATVLMLIGFATKAGLVPMHAWLPDAHSKAPAPISALLSGVLVSCALYAIMRTLEVGAALGVSPLLHQILLWLGATSVIVAGALMLAQRDLKRMLAYSTVEHAGIVALALGFGGSLGFLAALLHVVGHAFAKSAAFFAAGMVQRDFSTTTLGKLRGLWLRGGSGRLLLAAFVAISGMPPFGLFVSELLLVFAGIAAHQWVPLGLGLTGIALAFAAVARNAIEIESGAAKAPGIESSPALTTPRTFEQRIAARLAAVASGTIAVALIGALSIAVVPWTSLGTSLQRIAATLESAP
jgi:hydrogenase-4 component F